MAGVHLLLLAVSVLLARCQQQQKPQVSMSPDLKQIYSGDLLYLRCDNSTSASTVKWYFNDKIRMDVTDVTWRIAVAAPEHSGSYQCESNGQKSDSFTITVHDYIPRASLILQTGQPVMRTDGSVILRLVNDDGLQGWRCWVNRGHGVTKSIRFKVNPDDVSVDFQPKKLQVRETIFWCTDREKQQRSNEITVRTSEKEVSLETYSLPAVVGESLTLRCYVWGTDQITRAVFYKDNKIIQDSKDPTYEIRDVAESAAGQYKCNATYTYRARTSGPPYEVDSDYQDVFVQVPRMKANLDVSMGLSCSCPNCPRDVSYNWYYKDDDGQPWTHKDYSSSSSMMPTESGSYACRAVWKNGMSFLSNVQAYQPPIKGILIAVLVVLLIAVGLIIAAVACYMQYKKRRASGAIYEDVALRARDKGDDKYETLQATRREGEYDTLDPEAQARRQKKEGEYEPLKKEEMKGGEYDTLGMEGAAGGAGGYEALKREGMKEGVYHTLGAEGAAGGEGGYEALKKEGKTEGVYHTLGAEGAAGGEGGYEALKKESGTEGVYHTLGAEGAGGGEMGRTKSIKTVEEKK